MKPKAKTKPTKSLAQAFSDLEKFIAWTEKRAKSWKERQAQKGKKDL